MSKVFVDICGQATARHYDIAENSPRLRSDILETCDSNESKAIPGNKLPDNPKSSRGIFLNSAHRI